MSWLDDEAAQNKERETEERHNRELVQQSNYWGTILEALRHEVDAINVHGYWKTKLAGFALRFEPVFGGEGHRVSKSGFPAISVLIKIASGKIVLERDFIENPLSGKYRHRETLSVATMGESVVLVTENKETLVVPADVVKYILTPVIESLKITKSS